MMRRWARRLCSVGGKTAVDDYVVTRDGISLGRVLRAPYIVGTSSFQWSSWTHPAQSGRAPTLAKALQDCRSAIGDLPIPPHIARRLHQYSNKGAE